LDCQNANTGVIDESAAASRFYALSEFSNPHLCREKHRFFARQMVAVPVADWGVTTFPQYNLQQIPALFALPKNIIFLALPT
jgi:hypothetical protein